MVKWNKLKLSEKWSTRRRFNYIMNYIDSTFKDNPVSNDSEEPSVTEPEVETIENEVGNVIVSVTDDEDEKVANAKVTLTKGEDKYTGTTGSAGGCTIRNVPYGTYDIIVTADGYIDNIDTVTVDNDSINLDIIIQIE